MRSTDLLSSSIRKLDPGSNPAAKEGAREGTTPRFMTSTLLEMARTDVQGTID